MTLPKASPPIVAGQGALAPNTDETTGISRYSVKHQSPQSVRAESPKSASRTEPLGETALIRLTTARHLRLRARGASEAAAMSGPRFPSEQQIVELITHNIKKLVRSRSIAARAAAAGGRSS